MVGPPTTLTRSWASMQHLHTAADIQEEVLRTIGEPSNHAYTCIYSTYGFLVKDGPFAKSTAMFPDVKDIDMSTGGMNFETFAEPVGPVDPIWHHGEKFAQLLDLQREGLAARMDKEGQQRRSVVEQLTVNSLSLSLPLSLYIYVYLGCLPVTCSMALKFQHELREKEAGVTAELSRAQAMVNRCVVVSDAALILQSGCTARCIPPRPSYRVPSSCTGAAALCLALLTVQVGIADASAIEEEGFTEFILRHAAMAQRAVADLVAVVRAFSILFHFGFSCASRGNPLTIFSYPKRSQMRVTSLQKPLLFL
jgi:hypothetical protein